MQVKKQIFALFVLLAAGVGYLIYESITKNLSQTNGGSTNSTITTTTATTSTTKTPSFHPTAALISAAESQNVSNTVTTAAPSTISTTKPIRRVNFTDTADDESLHAKVEEVSTKIRTFTLHLKLIKFLHSK